MDAKLLAWSELEDYLHHPHKLQALSVLHVCTVMEAIDVADQVLKRRVSMTWSVYEAGLANLKQHGFLIEPLDRACLTRALFERPDSYNVSGLWGPACDSDVSPGQTVRRLILRPSDEMWWDDGLYDVMENWFL